MEADNLSLTRKERRAKANREANLKKPIISPHLTTSPFDFIFFTWFGPILRLVSFTLLLRSEKSAAKHMVMHMPLPTGVQKAHPACRPAHPARHSEDGKLLPRIPKPLE